MLNLIMFGKKRGFTLIELLVAISIIATLTAILLPNFLGAREKAQDSKKIQDLTALKNALRLYYNDNQSYPTGFGIGCSGLSSSLSIYLPDVADIGCTYYRESSGDAFRLCTWLNSGAGNEDVDSQKRCGIGTTHCGQAIGTTANNLYEVCAK